MCGRYNLRATADQLVRIFELLKESNLPFRYNIAPTQNVAVVRRVDAHRELDLLHWGLIPSWSKDPRMGSRLINARAETVDSKPSFRSAFKKRRCLIPSTGFYEWKKLDEKHKQPYHVCLNNDEPFAFAGLWEHWNANGREIESCTIITTSANELVQDIHDRMPVILPEESYDSWLDPKLQDKEQLKSLLVPYPAGEMQMYPVTTIVNNPRNEVPECVEEADE